MLIVVDARAALQVEGKLWLFLGHLDLPGQRRHVRGHSVPAPVRTGCAAAASLIAVVRHWGLRRSAQIIDEVAHFLIAEILEQPFGHHGKLAFFQRTDFVARHDNSFVGGDEGDGFFVLLLEDAGDGAIVAGVQVPGFVVIGNDGIGIDDVLQDVIEVASVRTGEIGADFAAGIEERVALLASAGENAAPA